MEKKWEEMSAEEKREARFATWYAAEGVEFQSPEAEAMYKASVTRFKDTVLMEKTPDRVPIFPIGTFMQTDLYGVTPYECMYDYDKLVSTNKQFLLDYKPDYYGSPAFIGSGKILEILEFRQYRWPGHGVSKNSGYQCVEGEYMKAEDYPSLIDDPSDFWLRTWIPRVFGTLAPLANLAPLTWLWEIVAVSGLTVPYGIPDVQNALKALLEAGNEAMVWFQKIQAFEMEAKGMGFPTAMGGAAKAPYDILADTLRGTRGIMTDLYRRPEMVSKAMERITPLQIKQGVGMATMAGNPMVFMPLHKGADGFLSDEQFRTFYWPPLKDVILGIASEGCVPFLFCEGSFNTRLKYLEELPRGSCFWIFDRTDMAKAKELIGDKICIGGNVPAGLLLTGTPEQVKAYCKELIDVAGKGGGFIMATGTGMDEGKPDTLHAMIDFTREYGVYR
ncbi:MAG: uroporphyrinogen decarboxylase [Deltaproteobacteria bacterium]|nr:uroporphyrinogen decarboxylase [Deltaproteobacteria bacterium]MBW1976530.1 uroporphyrinogen decarboxylase [Deltaproteobacteria bacterium]MBW2043773.1 uroporphyrinogen decarboxylase [Deltaproteobacteria bacterium]MBW2298710.1 uroporphyrinogen decarboxylase [Deltaproteobacteria bacterium]